MIAAANRTMQIKMIRKNSKISVTVPIEPD
jgi:hypothetical protein